MASCFCRACASQSARRNEQQEGRERPGLEITAKLTTVLEVKPAELLECATTQNFRQKVRPRADGTHWLDDANFMAGGIGVRGATRAPR